MAMLGLLYEREAPRGFLRSLLRVDEVPTFCVRRGLLDGVRKA